ncbi:MAG: hypothetical protein ACNA8G_03120 [Gammaproteobacteria bacterium]
MTQFELVQANFRPSYLRRGLDRRNLALLLLLSFLFPPILLYGAWKTSNFRQRHWLLTVFVGWYAVSLPVAFDPTGAGSDGVRHLLSVYTHYVDMTLYQFMSDLWNILLFKGAPGSNDVFKHVISYFVGGILGIPELFFPLVGLFYGYFFVGSMLIIFRNLGERKLAWVVIFLALCFFLTRNIDSMQAVRNPTAGWVLIYGILRYLETKRLRYVALMASTPLIHFSFLLIALPAFAYFVLGNRPVLYAVLFALSAPANLVAPDTAINLVSQVELGEQKLRNQLEEGEPGLDDRAQALDQQVQGGTRLWRAYMMAGYQRVALDALVFGLIISGGYFAMGRVAQPVFSNGLLMLTASNSLWFLAGATGRIWEVGFLLVMAGFLMWRLGPEFSVRKLFWGKGYVIACYLAAVIFVPYLFFYVSRLLDMVNLFIFAFPWMAWLYPDANLTVKEVLILVLPV